MIIKSKFRFVLIPILIFTLLLSMASFPLKPVYATEKISTVAKTHNQFPSLPKKGEKVEISEWRNANTKYYLKDDGSFEAEVYKDKIFYQDPLSKTWKDIDNTIVASAKAEFDYKNKANRFEVQFSKNTNLGATSQFILGKSSIKFTPQNISPSSGIVNSNNITYKMYSKIQILNIPCFLTNLRKK